MTHHRGSCVLSSRSDPHYEGLGMSVITVILNYNGKHTEVLLERLVGTQPTHPFAPLQRRNQSQTWVILLRTELPIVKSGAWGISRPTDDCGAGENQFAVLQDVLGSFSLSEVFNYLGWSSSACFVIIMKSEEHKTSLQQDTAIKSLLRAGWEGQGFWLAFRDW